MKRKFVDSFSISIHPHGWTNTASQGGRTIRAQSQIMDMLTSHAWAQIRPRTIYTMEQELRRGAYIRLTITSRAVPCSWERQSPPVGAGAGAGAEVGAGQESTTSICRAYCRIRFLFPLIWFWGFDPFDDEQLQLLRQIFGRRMNRQGFPGGGLGFLSWSGDKTIISGAQADKRQPSQASLPHWPLWPTRHGSFSFFFVTIMARALSFNLKSWVIIVS